MKYIIGIGTNLGNKINNINQSIQHIKTDIKILKISKVYESQAILKKNGYTEDDYRPYFNLAIMIEYEDVPIQLLQLLQSIELKMGRKHNAKRWSARIIDLDILIAENFIFSSKQLIIPHIHFLDRFFAVIPAAEIAPKMFYGKSLCTLKELASLHHKVNLNIIQTNIYSEL